MVPTDRKPPEQPGGQEPEPATPRPAEDRTGAFPIVGVGASAGGLDALRRLLQAMPPEPGLALVVVQHLDPTKSSMVPELLSRYTPMPVRLVQDEPRVRPNCVYVIPPGKYLSISQGELRLSEPDQPRGARMVVDFFLRSLAGNDAHCPVAVILSGTGTDGALGIKAVKAAGGLVIAQDPASAEHPGMPRSAVATGTVDHVLPPEQIPDVLVRYAQQPFVREAVEPAEDEEGQLEEELAQVKEDLQASIEQLEASNEEYKAANEEVMSINEELQSTNEELETSKEELQSLNEELPTVNAQLASKVEELETKHADLENLIAVTNVPTVCLDVDLAVRWFTPATQQLIRLKPTDRGRPLGDVAHDFVENDLLNVAQRVLHELTPVSDEVDCQGDRTFLRRITPYRADERRIGGVVITFWDVTQRKRDEQALRQSEQQLAAELAAMVRLHELVGRLFTCSEIAAAMEEVLNATVTLMGAEKGNVQLFNPSTNKLEIAARRGFSQDFLDRFGTVSADDESVCARALARRERVIVEDVQAAHFSESFLAAAAAAGYRAVQSTPLLSRGGGVLGMLSTHYREPHRPSQRDLRILDLYAQQAAAFIERQRGEEALHRLNEELERRVAEQTQDVRRLVTLVETSNDAIYTRALDGTIATWNAGAERLYGYTAEEMIGQSWTAFVPHDRHAELEDNYERLLRGELVEPFETRRVRKDGRTVHVSIAIGTIKDAADRVVGVASIARDVSARKQAEAELQKALQRLDAIVETAPSLIVVVDRQGRIVHFNRACEELTGYAREEMLGQLLLERLVPAGWRPEVERRFADLEAPELTKAHENPWLTKTGQERLIEWRCITLPHGGEEPAWFLLGLGIDATQQRLIERDRARLVRQQAATAALGVAALRERPLEELMDEAATTVANTLGIEFVKVLELLPDGELLLRAGVGWREGLVGHRTVGRGRDSQAGYALLTREPVIVDDLRTEARFNGPPLLLEHGVVSGVSCQIHGPGGEPYGVLGAHAAQSRHFSRDDVNFLQAVANVLGDAIQRKRFEQGLKQSEEQSRAVLASLPGHIAVIDRDGTIVAVNPAWEEFARDNAGVPQRCNVGANYLEACRQADDEGPMVADNLQAILDGAAASFTLEYPCHSQVRQRWFLLQAVPLRHDKGGAVVAHTNITDRVLAEIALRGSEERMRAILGTATDAIITIDQGGVIESVNPAAEQMFGYSAAEMVGQNVKMLMPSPYREEHDGYLLEYLQSGVARMIGIGREVQGRRKDGSVFSVDLAVSEVEPGELFTGILRDVTRRKELEREVVEIASLEQRRIGQDLHDTVAQELTGLSILAGGLAEAFRGDPASAALAERLTQGLRRSQDQLRVIMRGLLPVPVEKQGLMAALADLAERTAQEGGPACTFDCPEPVSLSDNLTATHLYLIAQEAVRNAIRHARPRHVRIRLEANDLLILTIEDDGVGMPSPSMEVGGLGLRIMRNRAAVIGAILTIEPAQPTGALVRCVLSRKSHERQNANETGEGSDRR